MPSNSQRMACLPPIHFLFLTLRRVKRFVQRKLRKLRLPICSGGHPACRIRRHLAARIAKPNPRHGLTFASDHPAGSRAIRQPGMAAVTGMVPPQCASHRLIARRNITVATSRFSANLNLPFTAVGKGKTALISALVWVWSGHNNIKLNPVFRGMVRFGEFLTKGKLC